MNILYVMGAGASCAIKSPKSVPGLQGMLPRIKETFPNEWQHISGMLPEFAVFDVGDELILKGGNSFSRQSLDIEGLLQHLDNVISSGGNSRGINAEVVYGRLVDLICRLLSNIHFAEVNSLEERGNPYNLLANAIARSKSSIRHRFVSLNYDIWLERALQKVDLWNPVNGYIDNLMNPIEIWFRGPNRLARLPTNHNPRILVLKPHGSLSWFAAKGQAGAPPLFNVDCDRLIGGKRLNGYVSYLDSGGEYQLNIRDGPRGFRLDIYRPLILPPTANKAITGEFLNHVYGEIKMALQDSDVIVVVGWSAPQTDNYIRQTFETVIANRHNMPKRLLCCDKQQGDVFYNRFHQIFRPSASQIYRGGFNSKIIDKYLSPLYANNG